MEIKDTLFTYEVISKENQTLRVKYGIGVLGGETKYFSKRSDISTSFKVIRIPKIVESNGIKYKVVEICKDLFHDLTFMEELHIPSTVDFFNWCFWNCKSLKNIIVDSQNKSFCSIDGVLFSKDKRTLIAFPTGRKGNYIIPEGTVSINSFAFKTSLLSNISIPESVKEILNNVFYRCSNLKEIKIPDGIKHVGSMADTESKLLYKGILYAADDFVQKLISL